MYRIVAVDKKYMVIVTEFYHDLGHAPHPSGVAARMLSPNQDTDDKPGFFFEDLRICQTYHLATGISRFRLGTATRKCR